MAISKRARPTVYLETTIVSYLTSRPSRDIIVLGRQELTRQWWEKERRHYALFVSPLVLDEARKGDISAAKRRMELLEGMQVLSPRSEIENLGEEVRKELSIPESVRLDALHAAYAIYYELDYLLTWNCIHLANAARLRRLADFSRRRDTWLPIICTPEEMTGIGKGEEDD